VCGISERCSQTSNNLEDQWIWKTTLLLRNGNLKGEVLETSKTEGEIFTRNVIDRLRYWKSTFMTKKSMPHGVWEVCVKNLLKERAFEVHDAFLLRVVVP
jgi:hypothetical protein